MTGVRGPSGRSLPAVLAVLGVLLVALLASACSYIPTSGPPRKGRDIGVDRGEDELRIIGQEPAEDASPEDVVAGFLQASADFVGDHAVARRYLAPEQRERWEPSAGTVVYDRIGPDFSLRSAGSRSVRLSAREVGRIDAEGHFARSPEGAVLTRTFGLRRVQGQWRISGLVDGLVLNENVVPVTYRRVNLYFLAPTRRVLVADPVFLPALPGLSSKLVDRLLDGPTVPLRGAVTTAFPQGTSLEVSSVPVRDGVAYVALDSRAARTDDAARKQMSAQLVWTLKQLSEVQSVRITVDGDPLAPPGYGEVQPADAWPGYDPDGLSGQPAPLAVLRAGRVAQLGDDRFAPVDGVAGTGQPPVLRPAVSLDSSQLAAVSADGRRLLVGPVTGDDPLQPVLGATELAVPSWDPSGNLWAVDRFNGRVWVVPRGTGQPVAVGLPRLGPGRVVGLRVSRDGARAALTVADGTDLRLLVAIVLRDPDTTGVRLTRPAEVLPALGDVQDVAWSDATTLAVLGSSDGEAVSPLLVDISGFLETPVETVPDLVRLTAAPPGRPLIAGTRTGRLLTYSSSGGWVSLGAGSDPAYPG